MARINIEDSIYRDSGFLKLLAKTGSEYTALGMVITAWNLSQKYWLKHGGVPAKNWPEDLNILLEVKIAKLVENPQRNETVVYVRGSKDQFKWLEQRSVAGKSRSTKKLTKLAETRKKPKRELNGPERDGTGVNETQPLSLSLSLSPTLPLSQPLPQTLAKQGLQKTERNRQVWEAYRDAYFSRYRVNPVRNAKVNKQISQLADRLGDEAMEIVKFYLDHPKAFYVSKMHDIGVCLADAEALRTQWARGKAVTENDIKRFSKNQEQQQLLDAIERGEV